MAEANKQLLVPVKVTGIDLTLWEKFPKAAIKLTGLHIGDSLTPVVSAEELFLSFDLIEIFGGKYRIEQIALQEASHYSS